MLFYTCHQSSDNSSFQKVGTYIKTNYIDLLYAIFKPVNKLEIPENSSL